MLLGWTLAFFAAAILVDFRASQFVLSEYARCGHIHVPVPITIMGVVLTICAVFAARRWWLSRARCAAEQKEDHRPSNP